MIGSINEVIYNFGYKIMCLKRERKGDKENKIVLIRD